MCIKSRKRNCFVGQIVLERVPEHYFTRNFIHGVLVSKTLYFICITTMDDSFNKKNYDTETMKRGHLGFQLHEITLLRLVYVFIYCLRFV